MPNATIKQMKDINDNIIYPVTKANAVYCDDGESLEGKILDGIKPMSHAATATTYGGGNATNYGHNKLSDTYDTVDAEATAAHSVGASAYALQQAYNTLSSNLTTSDETVFRFATDGEGNYGFLKADDSFVPFKKGGTMLLDEIKNVSTNTRIKSYKTLSNVIEFELSTNDTTKNACLMSFGGSNSNGGAMYLTNTKFTYYAGQVVINIAFPDGSIDLTKKTNVKFVVNPINYGLELIIDGKSVYESNNKLTAQAVSYLRNGGFVVGANESAPSVENFNNGTIYSMKVYYG